MLIIAVFPCLLVWKYSKLNFKTAKNEGCLHLQTVKWSHFKLHHSSDSSLILSFQLISFTLLFLLSQLNAIDTHPSQSYWPVQFELQVLFPNIWLFNAVAIDCHSSTLFKSCFTQNYLKKILWQKFFKGLNTLKIYIKAYLRVWSGF